MSSRSPKEVLKEDLKNVGAEIAFLRRQIAASEETFSYLPTEWKLQKLAEMRHKLHLNEMDFLEVTEKLDKLEADRRAYEKAARELAAIVGQIPTVEEVMRNT